MCYWKITFKSWKRTTPSRTNNLLSGVQDGHLIHVNLRCVIQHIFKSALLNCAAFVPVSLQLLTASDSFWPASDQLLTSFTCIDNQKGSLTSICASWHFVIILPDKLGLCNTFQFITNPSYGHLVPPCGSNMLWPSLLPVSNNIFYTCFISRNENTTIIKQCINSSFHKDDKIQHYILNIMEHFKSFLPLWKIISRLYSPLRLYLQIIPHLPVPSRTLFHIKLFTPTPFPPDHTPSPSPIHPSHSVPGCLSVLYQWLWTLLVCGGMGRTVLP